MLPSKADAHSGRRAILFPEEGEPDVDRRAPGTDAAALESLAQARQGHR
jgi:hypothetical protein